MRALVFVVLVSASAFAQAPKSHCVLRKDAGGNLPSAAWLGKRFALTWYARAEGEKVSFEQKFALLEPEGEVVGQKFADVTPVDGFSSVMGRLRVGPSGVLGMVWQDDASGERTSNFRTLDFTGKPKSEPSPLWKQKLPHGDQSALAWNEKTKQWLVVSQGTEPTERPGYVTHHLYATSFANPSSAKPFRIDAEESISVAHNFVVEPRGECGITAYGTHTTNVNGSSIAVATFCGEKVTRLVVSEKTTAKAPTQPTLAVRPDGSVLVAWVDEAPKETPPTAPAGSGAKGAPSRPFNAPEPPGLPRRNVVFALLDASGVVKVRGRLDGGGSAEVPAVLATENGWFVAWPEQAKDRTESSFGARISPEGNQQGPLINLSKAVAGPEWVTIASRGAKAGVLISHGNDAECAATWTELP